MNNNNNTSLLITLLTLEHERMRRMRETARRRRNAVFTYFLNLTIYFSMSLMTDTHRYLIDSSPFLLSRRPREGRLRQQGFWQYTQPGLTDSASLGNSFRRHYRMNLSTFSSLVSSLELHPVYSQDDVRSYPAYLQIAVVLWRFGNTHIPYRSAEALMGVSIGSYLNFTDRFLTAMIDTHGRRIQWPATGEEFAAISDGFAYTGDIADRRSVRLPNGQQTSANSSTQSQRRSMARQKE
ncbi:unnamed protein product [Absidia cylindrospora]